MLENRNRLIEERLAEQQEEWRTGRFNAPDSESFVSPPNAVESALTDAQNFVVVYEELLLAVGFLATFTFAAALAIWAMLRKSHTSPHSVPHPGHDNAEQAPGHYDAQRTRGRQDGQHSPAAAGSGGRQAPSGS